MESISDLKNLFPDYDESFVADKPGYCGLTQKHEVDIILRIGKAINAKNIFEFGTYVGSTTKILAEHFLRVYTIDYYREMITISPAQAHETQPILSVGKLARLPNVTQLFGNTLDRETEIELIGRYTRQMNLVYIDAGHGFVECLNDSLLALALVSVPGVIIWHDFKNENIGKSVIDTVTIIDDIIPVYHIEKTWLALGIVQ